MLLLISVGLRPFVSDLLLLTSPGGAYPVILGNNSDTHQLAVESVLFFDLGSLHQLTYLFIGSGSMLIMAYAHAVKSGDGSLINRYVSFPLVLPRMHSYKFN
jgi:hypothetical protein